MKKFLQWLKGAIGDLVFLGILICLLLKVGGLVLCQPPNLAEWLLVYLTAIYAVVAFYLALVSLKSAMAAERSAKAMEASIEEARLSRWAQFGAAIAFANGNVYKEGSDDSIVLELLNLFEQAILGLTVAIWKTEKGPSGEPEIRYSSMVSSQPVSVLAEQKNITVTLNPSNLPESQRRNLGEMALQQFKAVNKGAVPEHSLCMVTYSDRAAPGFPRIFVYDLTVEPAPKASTA